MKQVEINHWMQIYSLLPVSQYKMAASQHKNGYKSAILTNIELKFDELLRVIHNTYFD